MTGTGVVREGNRMADDDDGHFDSEPGMAPIAHVTGLRRAANTIIGARSGRLSAPSV